MIKESIGDIQGASQDAIMSERLRKK